LEQFTLYLLIFLTVILLLWEFQRRAGFLQLPFLFCAIYLGWVIPQIWAIQSTYPYFGDDLVVLNTMSALCLVATVLGWWVGNRPTKKGFYTHRHETNAQQDRTLVIAAVVLTFIAVVTFIFIRNRPEHELNTNTPSGFITILYFIFKLKILSLMLSMILFLRQPSSLRTALLVINCILYAPLLFVYFRRAAMAEFALTVALSFWFARGLLVPRPVILAGLPAGVLVLFAISQLRQLARGTDGEGTWSLPSFEQLTTVDFLGSTPLSDAKSAPEMLNALHLISLSLQEGFTFGAETWNRFVFQFVPAQIVGSDLKTGLMFETNLRNRLFYDMDHDVSSGSTYTGIGTAFLEFGFFGLIFFFASAYVLGRWYRRGCLGDPWAQILYPAGIVAALHGVTHHASYFFVSMIFPVLILGGLRRCIGDGWQRHRVAVASPQKHYH
jgi:hypothetical protein